MNAQDLINEIHENGKIPCFEIEDSVLYIEARGDKLVAGHVCNAGIIAVCSIDYDSDFSGDENLSALYEACLETLTN